MIHRVQALDQITPAVSSEMPQLHFDTQFEYPDPSTVGQHAVQPQVNRGRQPPYESWENAGQPSFDDGFGYEPPVHAVDPKLTLRSTAGADIDDALFRQTLLQFNGEHRAPALPITTNAQPPAPRRQSPNWGLGSFRPQGARGSRAAPTPARQRAAKGPIRPLKGNRATKPPTVPCSEPGCEKFFSTAQVMRDHIEAEHRGVRVPCTHPGCSLDFDNRANMGRHKMSVHNQVTHECPYAGCDYTATRRDNLKSRHMPVCPHRPENDNDNE